MRRSALVFALAAGVLAACGGGGGGGSSLPAALEDVHTVDGTADLGAFPNVQQVMLEFVDGLGAGTPTGKMTTLRWAFANDDRDLYVALEWDDATHEALFDATLGPTDFDGVKLYFDVDGDGVFEADEDERTVLAATVSSLYVDQHASAGDETDAVGDGRARLSYDSGSGLYTAELLFPMEEDANGEDGVLTAASRVNVALFDHVRLGVPAGNAVAVHGIPIVGSSTAAWDALPLTPSGPRARRGIPDDLTGLIAFVSTHEEALGEVYTFDPATGTTFRVTNDPTLHKDNCSLSHDRTRIAYHATPDPAVASGYEIYVVNVDGTGLVQLTSNAILDGHPAWSLDDARIAYASFREPGSSSIVVMQANGTEIADLTPPGMDDNDPDYLSDGRIVFKTDRFSTIPEVRIAVMDEDGTDVVQLTSVASVSDHDPAPGVAGTALFERFTKDTDYSSDVETAFVPWHLVEVRADGSGERTVLADPWLNWLPVVDPSGRYVAHVKNLGYADVHLVTLDGAELGRLIPDVTKVRYLDWK